MSNDYTLPLPPEPSVRMTLYGERCAEAARAPLLERIAELEKSFDELAAAVGWTRERCDQDGDSPVDVAIRLRADLAAKAGEVDALRAGIQKAIEEIDDAGPKALKYARQELETAIAQPSTPWVNPLAAEVEKYRADAERLEWLIANRLIAHQLSDSGLWMIVTGDFYPAIDGSEHETARNAIDDAISTLAARKGAEGDQLGEGSEG